MLKRLAIALSTSIASLAVPGVFAAPIVFSVGGDTTTDSIQLQVDAFRAALGDPNNGNAPGPLPEGRREINWDGGGNNDTTTAPVTPFEVFLDTRGARFTTPGTGLSQAPPSGGLEGGLAGSLIGNNPTYGDTFSTFSPLRLFVPVGSNITDGTFFIPGTAGGVPAAVSGFGAVFTDVDLANTTQIEFFDAGGNELFSSFVEPGDVADASLSFLGVVFDAGEAVSRVRITTGTDALGPNGPNDDPAQGVDVVAMDDFFYGEPFVRAVDEPSLPGLLAVVGLTLLAARRRSRPSQP
jgi:MYXO-CTERM domain-containing protein